MPNRFDRSHPVAVLLNHAAMGETPSDEQLDEVALLAGKDAAAQDSLRETISVAVEAIAELRAEGLNGRARTLANDTWLQLGPLLPAYEPPSDPELNPRALADRISR